MWFPVCVLVVTLLGRSSATVADSDKESSGHCRILVNDDDKVEIVFRLALNTDTNYDLFALDQNDYYASPSRFSFVPCNTNYNSTTKVYSVVSRIDRVSPSQSENSCGAFSTLPTSSIWSTQIVYFHQTGGEFRSDFIETKDRVFILECTFQNSNVNFVTANVRSELPINVNVPIYNPEPTLTVLREVGNSGVYVPVNSNDRVERGTDLKLSLEYEYGVFDSSRYYGVAGMFTQVSPNPSFNDNQALTFFDNDGCPFGVLAPDRAFYRVNNGAQQLPGFRTFEQQTGSFPLWSWEGTQNPFVYIRVFFLLCHGSSGFDQDPVCQEPCPHFTGRRRRDVEQELNSTVVMIKIYDPSDEEGFSSQESQSNEGLMIGIIVACVAVCVLLCLLLVAVLWYKKRRSSSQKAENYTQHGFENKAHMQY